MDTASNADRLPATSALANRLGPLASEDWLAVCVGLGSIAGVLAGIRPFLPSLAWTTSADLASRVFASQNLLNALAIGAVLAALAGTAVLLMGGALARFAIGFPAVYALALVAQLVAGNAVVTSWGLEYVIFAFALGLLVSNTIGVPSWLREAARTEFYIKTGLVILGASIIFGDMVQAGLLGITQALLVVTAVWFFCFWLAKKLRVDDEFATMLASAVSICGVSAAIAACGAIQGDRKKLSYVTSLVLIVAAPMMVVMPFVIRAFDIPDLVGGAWLGGTLDTSASVVAAGEMISIPARNAGVVVKLSQNVLIGVAAFLLTIWWTMRGGKQQADRPGIGVIWSRFPKFVLGFIAASFVFSFLISGSVINETRGILTALRTMWFALAFISIGLDTRFSDLAAADSGRAAVAFLGGQAFNVMWTLVLAYLLFGGMLFEVPAL
jgi:uncharacterized integral membrane protein (TIGR00698 family)